jgi:hypothetical protein
MLDRIVAPRTRSLEMRVQVVHVSKNAINDPRYTQPSARLLTSFAMTLWTLVVKSGRSKHD